MLVSSKRAEAAVTGAIPTSCIRHGYGSPPSYATSLHLRARALANSLNRSAEARASLCNVEGRADGRPKPASSQVLRELPAQERQRSRPLEPNRIAEYVPAGDEPGARDTNE